MISLTVHTNKVTDKQIHNKHTLLKIIQPSLQWMVITAAGMVMIKSVVLTKLTLDGLVPGVGVGDSRDFITSYVNSHIGKSFTFIITLHCKLQQRKNVGSITDLSVP